MNYSESSVRDSIIRDMSEGVMTLGLNGTIEIVNPAALKILNREEEDLLGMRFASCFFQDPENDAFSQAALDAVYEPETVHSSYVPYYDGNSMHSLRITSSCLHEDGKPRAVILVISDITELVELQDALKAMERIKALNSKLELRNQLLSETFGRFISDEVVKQLLDTPGGLKLGGKKAEISVIMSDLRGFTALSERMPAQDLLTMLNHYLGVMTDIIQANHGTIIEFIGDGIMCVFGAPTPSTSHAEQAVAAAVGMQAAMAKVNAWNRVQGFPDLEMGIGVHCGDMIVGNIGSEKRTKYGVTGKNVNLCGRIEGCTVGGQVLISEDIRKELKPEVDILDTMSVKPKGADQPITLYSIGGLGAPYGIAFRSVSIPPKPLETPCPVSFFPIAGKQVGEIYLDGSFTALSHDEAVLQTGETLNVLDNLQLDIGGKLFAKVIRYDASGYILRFTMRPEIFDAWLAKQK